MSEGCICVLGFLPIGGLIILEEPMVRLGASSSMMLSLVVVSFWRKDYLLLLKGTVSGSSLMI